MTSTDDDSQRFPLAAYLQAATTRAGYTIDPDELGPATGHHPDEIHNWVRAAAHHAAATHLRHLLDDPIEFFLDAAAHDPADNLGHTVDLLADLVRRRDALTVEQDRAAAALAAACQALAGTGLLWSTETPRRENAGEPADTARTPDPADPHREEEGQGA